MAKYPKMVEIASIPERQKYRCALSGDELTPENAALDHIIPLSQGGDHSLDNLQALTMTVNSMKGTMNNEEFVTICERVVKWSKRKRK